MNKRLIGTWTEKPADPPANSERVTLEIDGALVTFEGTCMPETEPQGTVGPSITLGPFKDKE